MASTRKSTFITVGEDYVVGDKNVYLSITAEAVMQRPLNLASPYLGLERFDSGSQHLFFGRERLIQKILADLKQSRVRILLGASGSGKSSLVRAGLIPSMEGALGRKFRHFSLFPDVNPFESLRSSLHGSLSQTETKALLAPPYSLLELIRRVKREDEQWLFFIDQFEEIFVRSDEIWREKFIASLGEVIADSSCSVRIVAAMRSDFFDRLALYPKFARLVEKHQDIVTELDEEELRRAIEQPAAQHGVTFEIGLVEEIVRAVQGQPGSLPLLQYTLDLLWRSSGDFVTRRILKTTYHTLGGVLGALEKRADEIYRSLGGPSDAAEASEMQDAARRILLRLVDFHRDGGSDAIWRPVRRRVPKNQFSTPVKADVLKILVDEKLLISGESGNVEVAHEALFTSWKLLRSLD